MLNMNEFHWRCAAHTCDDDCDVRADFFSTELVFLPWFAKKDKILCQIISFAPFSTSFFRSTREIIKFFCRESFLCRLWAKIKVYMQWTTLNSIAASALNFTTHICSINNHEN